ncbi:O-antigen/teichoic acid export membrane protein [Luteimonas cucumeris]|uniref:O-antigen/teichoic acid export membrane protein n=1 Tax=Luteimonas cucumeris TaxID=985012 RepID=A0A562L5D5_9GAMM|nr:oligosaccharide flippase family protein [Luteimonas cucumeris]TWI02882.1 O-antigen/teichoic acid export membrane protein [Luteimonas cucumeris]
MANTVLTTFWQFTRVGLQLLWTLIIARSLGAEAYGKFAGISGLAALIGTFSGIGMGLLMLQQVSRRTDHFPEYWRKAWGSTLPLGAALALAFGLAGSALMGGTAGATVFLLVGLVELLFLPLTIVSSYAFQAHNRMGLANMIYVFMPAANLLAGLLFLAFGTAWDLAHYLYFHAAMAALAALAAVIVVVRLLKPGLVPLSIGTTELREAAGFSLMRLADTGLGSFDKTLVLRLAGAEAAGAYTAAFRLATVLVLPVVALSMSALPRLFREGEHSRGGASPFVGKMLRHALVYGLLAGIVMWFAADLLPWLLGETFARAASAAKWMSLSPLLMGLCALGSNVLLTSQRRNRRILAQCIGLASMVLIAAWLMPSFGLHGAVLTLLAAQAVTAALLWALVFKKPPSFQHNRLTRIRLKS